MSLTVSYFSPFQTLPMKPDATNPAKFYRLPICSFFLFQGCLAPEAFCRPEGKESLRKGTGLQRVGRSKSSSHEKLRGSDRGEGCEGLGHGILLAYSS